MKLYDVVSALLIVCIGTLSTEAVERYVYHINNSDTIALTGFRLRGGERGIYTCLHGVAVTLPGKQITARNAFNEVYGKLEIKKLDVEHDLAILSCPELETAKNEGLEGGLDLDWQAFDKVDVIGFPEPFVFEDMKTPLSFSAEERTRPLAKVVSPGLLNFLSERGSPDPNCQVLVLNGALRPGHSGAPILGPGRRVIAVASGGIEKTDHGWAIPLSTAVFQRRAEVNDKDLRRLGDKKAAAMFVTGSRPEMTAEILSDLRILVQKQSKLIDDFSERSTELRNLVKQLGQVSQLSLSIRDIELLIVKASANSPQNQKLKEVADMVEEIVTELKDQFPKGEFPTAIVQVFQRSEIDIAIARGNYQRVLVILNDQRMADAKETWERQTQAYVTELTQRAAAFRGLGQYENAFKTYVELLRVSPRDSVGIICLAEGYIRIGQPENAYQICCDVADFYRSSANRSKLSLLDQAKLVQIQSMLVLIGLELEKHPRVIEECTAAIDAIESLRRKTPDAESVFYLLRAMVLLPDFFVIRGKAKLATGQTDSGIEDLSKAVKLADDVHAVSEDNLKVGIETWLQRDAVEVRRVRARAYRQLKMKDNCLQDYNDCIEILSKRLERQEQEGGDTRKTYLLMAGIANDAGFALQTFGLNKQAVQSLRLSIMAYKKHELDAPAELLRDIDLPFGNLCAVAESDMDSGGEAALSEVIAEVESAIPETPLMRGIGIVFRERRAQMFKRMKREDEAQHERQLINASFGELRKMAVAPEVVEIISKFVMIP